jgi:hypothetical protein
MLLARAYSTSRYAKQQKDNLDALKDVATFLTMTPQRPDPECSRQVSAVLCLTEGDQGSAVSFLMSDAERRTTRHAKTI